MATLGRRVERGAEVVPAAAAVENHQSRLPWSQAGIALVGQELLMHLGST